MLQNILNLDGVTQLTKEQQSAIKGGDVCAFRLNNGLIVIKESDDANGECVEFVEATDLRCQYDCGSDGFTASWLQ